MRLTAQRLIASLVLFTLSLLGASSQAGDEGFSPKQQVDMLLKAVGYDGNLASRCPKGLRVGVLVQSGSSSMGMAKAIEAEFHDKQLLEVPIFSTLMEVNESTDLNARIEQQQINTLFLGAGLDDRLPAIVLLAQKKKILLLANRKDYIAAGFAIGVVMRQTGARFMVNQESALAQGVKLDARFLRLADMVGAAAGPKYQPPEKIRERRVAGVDPEYPKIARTAKLQATLLVKITIDPEGAVEKIEFVKTNDYFEKAVREAVATWKFAPSLINDKPVATYTMYKFEFKLQ